MTTDQLIRFEEACIAAGRFTLASRARVRRYARYFQLTQRSVQEPPLTSGGTYHNHSGFNRQIVRGRPL